MSDIQIHDEAAVVTNSMLQPAINQSSGAQPIFSTRIRQLRRTSSTVINIHRVIHASIHHRLRAKLSIVFDQRMTTSGYNHFHGPRRHLTA